MAQILTFLIIMQQNATNLHLLHLFPLARPCVCHRRLYARRGILAPIPQVQTTFPTIFPSISLAPVHQTWNWVIGSPGQWVIFHVRVIISTRCETRVFPVFHCKRLSHNYGTTIALPGTMQILLFGAGYKYSYLLTLSSTRVLDQ